MQLTIIGAGYVGLVSGACFADFGHVVTCVDQDAKRIAALEAGIMPIYEPGLDEMVAINRREGRLRFTTDVAAAVKGAEAVFIAVGTPTRGEDGQADLRFVEDASRAIARALNGYKIIVTKSTVPVGTGDHLEEIIRQARPDARFAVVSNPEFLREGAAIEDFKRPDRIIIGTLDHKAREIMTRVYRPLSLDPPTLMFTDRRTSELIKYAANAFLATKITFINEIADLCEKVGANVQDVSRGMGLDNRIGNKFLLAGPGFGGSCFPKDTLALIKTGEDHGAPLAIVSAVSSANERRKRAMADKVITLLGQPTKGATVGILGLTFKPDTDDIRDAPSLAIIPALQAAGISVRAFDPHGIEAARPHLPGVQFCTNAYDCAESADALVIVTEWESFRALDLSRIRSRLKRPLLIDLRNIYAPEEARAAGLVYHSIGRPTLDRGDD
jgi:UDPglucose 6-dehydrogenase